jgi:hypothetical protein
MSNGVQHAGAAYSIAFDDPAVQQPTGLQGKKHTR